MSGSSDTLSYIWFTRRFGSDCTHVFKRSVVITLTSVTTSKVPIITTVSSVASKAIMFVLWPNCSSRDNYRNVGNLIPVYTALQPTTQPSSYSRP
jgi:hypothetical protein